jgi:hypothetical protein
MAKAKAKYADLVQPLRLWTELVRPSFRGKMADFSLLYDEKVQPKTKIWVEIFYAYAPGTGAMVPGETTTSYSCISGPIPRITPA